MKKIFLLTFGAMLLFTACKKDYSCTCEIREIDGGDVAFGEIRYDIEEASRKQAKMACNEVTIKEVDKEYDYSYETTCELDGGGMFSFLD